MCASIRPGDVLADRYRLEDLLDESRGARFWRAHDRVLARHVAVHVIASDDERAAGLLAAARRSAAVTDRHFLRVLDADERDGICFVVNEWGSGTSLDVLVSGEGPLDPRRAAWVTAEVAAAMAAAHEVDVVHGRLAPENVLLDHQGSVRVIGLAVDAALHGLPPGRRSADLVDLGGLLYAGLTGRWAGVSQSMLPAAPVEAGRVLRPRKVRAGIPRPLDGLCLEVLGSSTLPGARVRGSHNLGTARGIADQLCDYLGDPAGPAAHPAPSVGAIAPFPAQEESPAPAPQGPRSAAVPPPAEPDERDEPDAGPPTGPTPVVELPTQAGLPIFGEDGDDVSWLAARPHPPPPPPAFEEPTARPLFAPDPPPGSPARRSRPSGVSDTGSGWTGAGSAEYWPWPGTGTGPVLPADSGDDPVPGRRWLRLAMVIAAAALLMLGIVVVSKLGQDGTAQDSRGVIAPVVLR